MIEFFEFMNGCSPTRTVVYLLFILIVLYMTISVIGGVTEMILYRNVKDTEDDGIKEDDKVED